MTSPRNPPRWLRRTPWERGTAALIGLGLAMLMQPWSMDAFSYSFVVLLAGVVGYSIAGKLPEGSTAAVIPGLTRDPSHEGPSAQPRIAGQARNDKS